MQLHNLGHSNLVSKIFLNIIFLWIIHFVNWHNFYSFNKKSTNKSYSQSERIQKSSIRFYFKLNNFIIFKFANSLIQILATMGSMWRLYSELESKRINLPRPLSRLTGVLVTCCSWLTLAMFVCVAMAAGLLLRLKTRTAFEALAHRYDKDLNTGVVFGSTMLSAFDCFLGFWKKKIKQLLLLAKRFDPAERKSTHQIVWIGRAAVVLGRIGLAVFLLLHFHVFNERVSLLLFIHLQMKYQIWNKTKRI